jgi:hypothetical protein
MSPRAKDNLGIAVKAAGVIFAAGAFFALVKFHGTRLDRAEHCNGRQDIDIVTLRINGAITAAKLDEVIKNQGVQTKDIKELLHMRRADRNYEYSLNECESENAGG